MFYYAFLWITTNVKGQESGLASALIEEGFDVGPAASNRSLITGEKDSDCLILGYRIGWLEVKTMDVVWKEVSQAMEKCNLQYYSVIVAEATDSRWCASNIKPPPKNKLN